ncbi:MAG: 23S rRNA (pseudouridine(1915)-N(3))-methyltransferase RlmH, partial [Pseudomonadota bacterium]|nr:23S rRNA (pseudouridine(1915)-N(3))-methyltransferase RlmH [Pseudomonadota bacterium]
DDKSRRKREAELITAAIPDGATIVALDETGRNLTSREFAKRLSHWRDTGTNELVFIIGGADGLTDEIRNKATLVMAFGKSTWPHLLVRGMLAEQLYRAQQIHAGHPYHRD